MTQEIEMTHVLDKGYVRLVDVLGSDLTVVNAARVSYDKASTELSEKDRKLIAFLAKNGHTSPFRHATMQFEVYAPLMVARQHWKYIVGSSMQDNMVAWNESSRRYVTEEPTFYVPDSWRGKPQNSKQGSDEPLGEVESAQLTGELLRLIKLSEQTYEMALGMGLCAEQARLFLPAYGMYVRYYWTASLAGVAHFLTQRLESHAQWEIREYAKAVEQYARKAFPVSINALVV